MSEWDTYPLADDPWAAFPKVAPPQQGALKATSFGPLNAPLNAFSDFTGQMGRAATFGLQDKAAAFGDTTAALAARGVDYLRGATQPSPVSQSGKSISDMYHEALAQQRGYGQAYAEANPIASPIATGIGIAGSTGATAAGQAALLASKIPGARVASQFAAPSLLDAAKSGATVGGLAGFGASNDQSVGQTALDTAASAGTGLLAGMGMQAAGPWISSKAADILNSPLMHKFQNPTAAIIAALEGFHNPRLLGGAAGAWAGLQGASRIPPGGWAQFARLAARGAGSATPGLLSAEQSDYAK
jgi:hypothetical protein